VKMLTEAGRMRKDMAAWFAREVAIMQQLQRVAMDDERKGRSEFHRHVIRTVGVVVQDMNESMLVLELCAKGNLLEVVKNESKSSLSTAKLVFQLVSEQMPLKCAHFCDCCGQNVLFANLFWPTVLVLVFFQ
jgi:serine/threonine protein kinase